MYVRLLLIMLLINANSFSQSDSSELSYSVVEGIVYVNSKLKMKEVKSIVDEFTIYVINFNEKHPGSKIGVEIAENNIFSNSDMDRNIKRLNRRFKRKEDLFYEVRLKSFDSNEIPAKIIISLSLDSTLIN